VLRAGGKLEEARALLEDSLAAAGILFGQDHSTFTSLRYDLAILLVSGVDTDRAFLLLQEHLAQIRGLHGSRHPVVAATLANLAAHAFNLGRHDDAKRYIEDALSILDASVDRCHDTRVSAVNLSALVSAQLGDADAGIERGQEALQCVAGKHGISHARYKEVAGSLATIMLAQKRYEDVEAVLDPILQVLPPLEDATTFDSEIMRMAAFLHQAQGREGDALAWGQKALAVGRRLLPADSTWLADYEYDVGGFLVGLGRCEEALPLLEHGVDIQQAAQAGAMVVARTRLLMVRCLERSDPKRARELAAQALPTFEAEPRWAEDRDYLRSVAGVRRPSKTG
jgi:tetratricopeptide (TPR) repeat protein